MKTLTLLLAFLAPAQASVIHAIAAVESNHDPNAVGDNGTALGILQITPAVVADVNRRFGPKLRHEDSLDPVVATRIFQKYMAIYATEERIGRPVTDEDRARIWNGGPDGWRKESTVKYWEKVKRNLK